MTSSYSISKSSIPHGGSPILGRETEITALIRLLEQHSVVTITGAGGIGKTRIAIEICHRVKHKVWDEVVFLSMASLTDHKEIMPALADDLGITETADRSLASGVSQVLAHKDVLLVLDNLEHINKAAMEISELVAACPDVKVLCTSRTPLKISIEQEYPLHPLPVPSAVELEQVSNYPVMELFIGHAQRVNKEFELTSHNANIIVEICQYLDGLPLAIELAASRMRVISPHRLLETLKKTINVLSDGSKDLPERHRALRNTIEWSHALLDAAEKRLFSRLSVFAKGFDMEAIEAICYSDGTDTLKPIKEIESLVDKSLVQRPDSNHRFSLLQTVRDFALEKLEESNELDTISMQHARYFHSISERISQGTQGTNQQINMQRGIVEEANIILALDRLLTQAQRNNFEAQELGFGICGNLWTFWHIHGKHVTTKEYINAFLAASDDSTFSVRKCAALFSLHVACYTLGEIELSEAIGARLYKEAQGLGDELETVKGLFALGFGNMFSNLAGSIDFNARAIALCEELGSLYWLGLSLWQKGIFNLISGNLDIAKTSYSKSLDIFIGLNENEGTGIARSGLCILEFMAGNYQVALEQYAETLTAFRAIGDRPEEARVLSEVSWTHLAAGDTHLALDFAMQSIEAHRQIGSNRGIGLSLNAFAAIEAVKGRPGQALEIAAAARRFADQKGVAIELGINNHGASYLESAKQQLSDDEIEQAERAGSRYSIDDVIAVVENQIKLKPFENAFIQKLEIALAKNISDSEFGVNQLSAIVALSPTQLYRKLKALKNQSPSQFIRKYRLAIGRDLLVSSDKSVAEVAYQVGFVDPNYFSRAFSKEYSQPPSALR